MSHRSIAAALISIVLLVSCPSQTIAGGSPDCARLADPLRRIADATDIALEAQMAGVPLIDGAVRVIVELEPDRAVPADLPGVVEAQYLQFVQVKVEPARLCELADHVYVRAVQAPAAGVPDRPLDR